jgi:hypothetical protein
MKSKKLTELSLEELKKQQKTLKIVSGAFIGVLLALCMVLIYTYFKTKELTPLMIMPVALSPLAILNYLNIKKITKEINSRKH